MHQILEHDTGADSGRRERTVGRATLFMGVFLGVCVYVCVVGLGGAGFVSPLWAQEAAAETDPILEPDTDLQNPTPDLNTTIMPRTVDPGAQQETAQPRDSQVEGTLRLVAQLQERGKTIDRGIIWRIFEHGADTRTQPRLLSTEKSASPLIQLAPGKYVVNAAYGRAHLTKIVEVRPSAQTTEKFILHAGGLKLRALVDGNLAPKNSVQYDVLEGEPDQSGERKTVIANARPLLIIRLNAGIYRIVSRYGDANAVVIADVQVEAGKLTVASISHAAAKVTFKLVDRPGGEALPGIQWSISTVEGEIVKKSVGALPTHILAPGSYSVTAVSASGTYRVEFAIQDGQMASVEVVMN